MARGAEAGVDAAEDFGRLLRLGVVPEREGVLVLRLPRAGGPRSLACAHGSWWMWLHELAGVGCWVC